MNRDNISTGKLGEEIACGYLERNSYKILKRNIRTKFGEIDIISKSSDKTLVFVEVKTIDISDTHQNTDRESYPHYCGNGKVGKPSPFYSNQIMPSDNMTKSKMVKFKRIAEWYANNLDKEEIPNGYRLDFISILIDGKDVKIDHIKNI